MRREEDSSRIPSAASEEKEEWGSSISGSITRSTTPRTSGKVGAVFSGAENRTPWHDIASKMGALKQK